jgi:hypothetical protein
LLEKQKKLAELQQAQKQIQQQTPIAEELPEMLTLKHATSVIVMNKKEQEHQQQLELMKKQQ